MKTFVLKVEKISIKNFEKHDIVQAWGEDTTFFLVDKNKIVAGAGKPAWYIAQIKKNDDYIELLDDGNGTTKFPRNRGNYGGYGIRFKIDGYAYGIKEAIEKFPKKGQFTLYTMK